MIPTDPSAPPDIPADPWQLLADASDEALLLLVRSDGALRVRLANAAARRLAGVVPGAAVECIPALAAHAVALAGAADAARPVSLSTRDLSLVLRPAGDGLLLLRLRPAADPQTALPSQPLVEALQSLDEGFVLFDADDRVVMTNSRFHEYYPAAHPFFRRGATFEEALRACVGAGAIVPDEPDTEAWIRQRLERHRNPSGGIERRLPDGRLIRIVERRTSDGGTLSLGLDITALAASEARFRDLVDTVPGMVYQWVERSDGSRGYSYVSPRCHEMFGVEAEALLRDWRLIRIHPDDAERWQASIDAVLASGGDWEFEGRFVLPDGAVRWWRGFARQLRFGPDERRFNGIVIDIDAQKRAEEALQSRQAMLRYTAGLAGLGYWIWDAEENRIVYWSPELAAIRGVPVDAYREKLGTLEQLLDAIHPDDRQTYLQRAVQVARNRGSYAVEYRMLRPDGELRHVSEVGGPVYGAGGRLTKFVGAVQDITLRKQRELELEDARDRLERQALEMTKLARALAAARDAAEAASRAKSRFLAVMSHELRTPMTGVIGMIDLLAGTPLSPEQQQYVETLRSSSDSLLVVVNDILDFSKIEEGQLTLERIPLRLPALLEDVRRLFTPAARRKGVDLLVQLPPQPVPDLMGDPTRLRQVLTNLMGNAVKFTERGRVELRLTDLDCDGSAVCLRVEVSDTGIGMDSATLTTLFEPFSQADASTTRRFGGTGLGLAICKRLIGMMGGEIGVDSRLGAGSTFWFSLRLPLVVETARPAPAGGKVTEEAPMAARVLLAEDNQVNRLLITAMLQRKGFQVEAVVNGVEAVEAVRRDAHDVVLMDMQMPLLDGDGAAATIRGLAGPERDIPIVALTAEVLPEERLRRMNGGLFDGYMTKPVDWTKLTELVTSLAQRWRERRGGGDI